MSAFLKYCELQGYRSPDTDCYGWAYLCQVVGNFFGDGMSVGIDRLDRLDSLDEENNYVVLKFEKDIDWTNAISILGLKRELRLSTRKDGTVTKGMRSIGIGRVIDGVKVLNMIKGAEHEGIADGS